MADLYLFIETFWPLFWPLLPATAFFGLDELAKVYFPGVARQFDMIPARARRYIEVLALVGVTFYAGFLAWQQEHAARVRAEQDLRGAQFLLPDQGSKFVVSKIEPLENAETKYAFKVTFQNRGKIDGDYPDIYSSPILAGADDQFTVESQAAAEAMKSAQKSSFASKGNQVVSGNDYWISLGWKLNYDSDWAVRSGVKKFGFLLVLKYSDPTVKNGFARYTTFCAYPISGGTGGWNFCHSFNETKIQSN